MNNIIKVINITNFRKKATGDSKFSRQERKINKMFRENEEEEVMKMVRMDYK